MNWGLGSPPNLIPAIPIVLVMQLTPRSEHVSGAEHRAELVEYRHGVMISVGTEQVSEKRVERCRAGTWRDRARYWMQKTRANYRAMHFSAKRGIAIACRLSVCL